MLGNFELTGRLSSQNSGCSVWGFGNRDGESYFIKQFLSPKYPENDTVSSPARLERKYAECTRFEQKKRKLYQIVNRCSDGNAVRIREFFRVESKYYIATKRIEALPWDVKMIASLDMAQKRRLIAIIAHSIASLHDGGVIHADLKHENILFVHSQAGLLTAKIIDFDSSFLESNPPAPGEEIIGDLVYFSPEALRSMAGEEISLNCKMDVFALGVLFHQYLTGELPYFDQEQFGFPAEASANGGNVWVSEELEPDLAGMLQSMLHPEAECRPTAWQVFEALRKPAREDQDTLEYVSEASAGRAQAPVPENSTTRSNPFFRPGDL